MLPQEIIRKKRNHQTLSDEEIKFFIQGVSQESISDCQIGALTMAIFLNGLNHRETVTLTKAMRDSGDVLDWSDLDGPVVDKHSTGGVGDKVSLMLAPILACCGVYVPMISGRGLGHTGGTLDKFDSIKGYNTAPSNELFKKTVKEVGCAIIGQTGNLAPADKRIYAIRDVCGTVESIPLITASILSKKLAAGLDCLVMDVKCGNGAFMETKKDSEALAELIVQTANAAGTKTTALLTDMNQVLGHNVGNALEMQEAVDYLKGINQEKRLHEVTMSLCAELLVTAKRAKTLKEAEEKLTKVLSSGQALEKFQEMVSALGGPKDFISKTEKYLPQAKIIRPIYAKEAGYVNKINTRAVGLALIGLKGGRTTPTQKLDYATGFKDFCQIGDYLDSKTPLAFVCAQDEASFAQAQAELRAAVKLSATEPTVKHKTILKRIK